MREAGETTTRSAAVVPGFVDAAATAMAEAERRFNNLMDHAPVMVWSTGPDRDYCYFNLPWLSFTGRSPEQEYGNGWMEGLHPLDRERFIEVQTQHVAARERFRVEYRLRRHDGVYRWLLDQGMPRYDEAGVFAGYIGSCTDITDLKDAEARRQRDLEEKSALLEELHHRVRNNAQLFASLLTMQASRSAAPQVKHALATAAARASTLAVAQDQMHATEDPASFDLHNYVYMLTQAAGPMTPANVRIHVESDERVWVPLSTVVPIGLIVHELITNAMRHAFPDGRRGSLNVHIRRTPAEGIAVIVFDDGIGLPVDFDFGKFPSVGSTIVRRLAAQLHASVSIGGSDPVRPAASVMLPSTPVPAGARITLELPRTTLSPARKPRPATVSAFAR